eukprot:CAMPEP_0206062960 /NCGR_PEP_ID=MMETSP1466-20131121/57987_1 /ASSEMBLY_ACC=CAM_ASM_001126 /TAXON_ID=44452 /ORGANISM="Pavlova gyrans, Strain CCMP608" /LENGTH=113 /DNA_ID=CAMNT_0053438325 /DNA_START=724 /DNA_END=1065 /DNA_ORIENTATION=-
MLVACAMSGRHVVITNIRAPTIDSYNWISARCRRRSSRGADTTSDLRVIAFSVEPAAGPWFFKVAAVLRPALENTDIRDGELCADELLTVVGVHDSVVLRNGHAHVIESVRVR